MPNSEAEKGLVGLPGEENKQEEKFRKGKNERRRGKRMRDLGWGQEAEQSPAKLQKQRKQERNKNS